MNRQLRLGAFMRPVGIHTAWWRHPGRLPDANFNVAHLQRFAQTLDPLTLLPALAVVTKRLGLVATASTTYEQPYHVARKFSSLDHLSGGRAGWNVVTTSNPDAARNFGMEHHPEHADRYDRAREFVDVVTGLWDSWADDAFVRDVESGIFFHGDKMHVLDHRGRHFSVRGPLNVARRIQGWPVIFQAGASEAGKQLAAETADVVFAGPNGLDEGRFFYADVKGRATRIGRDPDHLKIMPACFVVVGETEGAARGKQSLLDSLVHVDSALASLSVALGCDASGFDLDASLPQIPDSNGSRTSRDRALQLALRVGGYAGLTMVGSPRQIADEMQSWLEGGAADGFNVMFSDVPAGLEDFVDLVVPELQRRGIFRQEYEGNTLRHHLGLPRPDNRFFPSSPQPDC